MGWSSQTLRRLHIELTNHCNAACPVCPRYYRNSTIRNPWMTLDQICYDDFVRWFPPSILGNIKKVLLCGTHGDPAAAPDLIRICEYILYHASGSALSVMSNGGIRNETFWKDLGSLFSGTNSRVVFSIDGLADTNHIYRRNVDWDRLMSNVRSYIDAGGTAVWHYLVFRHNEAQIGTASELATSLGFSGFVTKRALGFDYGNVLQRLRVMGSDGRLQYWIDPPDDVRYRNIGIHQDISMVKDPNPEFDPDNLEPYVQRPETFDRSLDGVDIDCKSLSDEGPEIYVDCHGIVHPCCWVGVTSNGADRWLESVQLKEAIDPHVDRLDLRKVGNIAAVLDSGVLDRIYLESWGKPSCSEGKLQVCAATCPKTKSAIDRIYE